MTVKHVDIITRFFEQLANNLTADGMLNKLVAESIITITEQEEILIERVTSKRAGVLLRLLLKREDRTFYVLIEALRKYTMPHLAKLLEDAGRYTGLY